MNVARVAVDRPVLATVLIVALVVFGAFSFFQLSQELIPKIDFPVVVVTTVYPGAGPKEVETQVTEKLEEEIGSVAGLRKLDSQSLENLSIIIAEFELEVPSALAASDVKDKVDLAVQQLPDDADPPVVQQFSFGAFPVLNVAVSSDRPLAETTHLADTRVKDALSRVPGVSKVELVGGLQREIVIACHADRLRSYGLSILDVAAFIQAENLNFPAGTITGPLNEYSLRMVGEFTDLDELRRTRLVTPSGAVVHLRDIADVEDAHEDPRTLARFLGRPAVSLQVMKKDDANTVQTSDGVTAALAKLRPWLDAERIDAVVANDRADYIRESVRDVLTNIVIGILLTSLLLYLFLHDIRSTVIVAVVMPASIVATFSLMYFADFTINNITLMAIGISIGVLVTNSIVVLENINNKLAEGMSSRDASVIGTSEIAVAVIASTMTNLVVFSPIAFMKGIIGRFFYQFGLTVVFATLVSLVMSFTMTPLMAKLLLKRRATGEVEHKHAALPMLARFDRAWDRFYDELASDYRQALTWALHHRALVMIVTALSFAGGCGLMTQVGSEFFPHGDEGIILIQAKLPAGTSIEQTDRTLAQVRGLVENLPEVKTTLSEIGGSGVGVEEGQITLKLVGMDERDRSTDEIVDAIRPRLASIPAADIRTATSAGMGGGADYPIQIEITGPDLTVVNGLAEKVAGIARSAPGVIDVHTTYESGKPELSFVPDRSQMSHYGVTSLQVAMALRTAFQGSEVSYYREAGEDYDVRVRMAGGERADVASFENVVLRTAEGYLPLTQLGQITLTRSETKIERKNKQRVIRVRANVSGTTSGEAVELIQPKIAASVTPPPGYEIFFAGEAEHMAKEFGYIFQALILAILLTYLVLAAILEDFVHPFTIMLTLPLGMIGVALALFVGAVSINLMSLMAIVMLVGIVVNNAILILDYAKQLRLKGKELVDALLEASSTRLRPIIMTNLAIAVSVAPQAVAGAGAEFRRALAVVTMGGVLVSAVFTLFLIPCIYTAFDRFTIKPAVEPAPSRQS